MIRKLLIIILTIDLIIELALTGGIFFARETTLDAFKVAFTNDVSYIAYVLGWMCLFTSSICALTLWKVWKNHPDYDILCYFLGFFWIGIGLGLFIAFNKQENLWIDSLKGLIVVILTRMSQNTKRSNSTT